MKEVFYEETAVVQDELSATKKYNLFKSVSISLYVLTGLWIILYVNFYTINFSNPLLDIILFIIPFVILLLSAIFIGKLKNKFYVDYDYTFITGTVRVAKVIKNIKRKFLLEFNTSTIEKIGLYQSQTYYKYENFSGINKQIFTLNDTPAQGKDFYYIVANVNGEKNLLLFECTEQFIINILKFSNKQVFEKESK